MSPLCGGCGQDIIRRGVVIDVLFSVSLIALAIAFGAGIALVVHEMMES